MADATASRSKLDRARDHWLLGAVFTLIAIVVIFAPSIVMLGLGIGSGRLWWLVGAVVWGVLVMTVMQ